MQDIVQAFVAPHARWLVLSLWLALGALFPFAGKLQSIENDDVVNYLPETAQSTQVEQLLKQFSEGQTSTAVVVYVRLGGLGDADLARIRQDQEDVPRKLPAAQPFGPVVPAPDGNAALFFVRLPYDPQTLPANVSRLRALVESASAAAGSIVGVTGPAVFLADEKEALQNIDFKLLSAAAGAVTVLLLLIYRSPLLCVIPLATTVLALAAARATIYGLALSAGLTVTGVSAGILSVLVFGAGIDYALLLIARYRQELQRGGDARDAMTRALRHAAPAIIASAATVGLGLLCLLAATLKSDKDMGPVAAVGIFYAAAAALTALPALLLVCGRWAFWPSLPHASTKYQTSWSTLGTWLARRPRVVWVVTVVVLAAGAGGLANLQLGLPKANSFIGSFSGTQDRALLEAHFPPGAAGPTVVIVRSSSVSEASEALKETPGVVGVREIGQTDGLTQLGVILSGPPDSPAAYTTIDRLRARLMGSDALVGGSTAIDLDVEQAARRDRSVVMPLVLAVVIVVLGVLLRAVAAPLVLVATVVLSYAAALGVSSLVFDWAFGFAGVDASVLLDTFIFLVALGTDYNIFLMNRTRQEAIDVGTRRGLQRALALTGGVITSAGIVLAATFSALAILPLVVLVEVGFAVAFGVLLDTFVVRSVLVPAIVLDLGKRIWWPSVQGSQEQRNAKAM
jgi:putative drug exporter of the RND superfamily